MSRGNVEQAQIEFQGAIQPKTIGNVGAAPIPDANAAESQVFTLTANATFGAAQNTSGLPVGSKLCFVLIQDPTGTRTVGWNAQYKNAPALAAGTAGQRALVEFRWDGVGFQFVGGSAAFA
jgi:hypothetical protein